jgi:hypothetical protein
MCAVKKAAPAKKAAKKTALSQRSTQAMNIDFYRIQDDAGGPTAFRDALIEAMRARGRNRSALVAGERIDLYECTRQGSLIQGEFGRVRLNDVPAIADEECGVSEIALQETEGVTERTAFLLDVERAVLVVHSRREAASASRIAGYCDRFANNRADTFFLKPLLRADAEGRFRSMVAFKRIDVEYTRSALDVQRTADAPTRSFLTGLNQLDGQTITVGVSSGQKKADHLSYENVQSVIRTAMASPQERVLKLEVSGRGRADEALFVDLLEDRLRVKKNVGFIGRSPSYETRREAVRSAYDENLEKLAR